MLGRWNSRKERKCPSMPFKDQRASMFDFSVFNAQGNGRRYTVAK